MKDNGSNDISSRTGREVRAVIAEAVVVGSGRAGGQGCMVLEESGLVYMSSSLILLALAKYSALGKYW